MKREIGLILTSLYFALNAFAQNARHVILVTIDGMRSEFYLNADYPAPNLKYLVQHGTASKRALSVFPTVTYPNHTTIVTGALPDKHGIYCNEPFEPGGITGRWFWYADSIKVPTLFTAAHRKGLKTAAVLWPVQVGAPIDYNVPDIWNPDTYDRVTPIDDHMDWALWKELQEKATGMLSTDDLNESRFSMDENTTRLTAYIIRKYKPAFTALHLIGTDDQQHDHGTLSDSVKLAVASVDHCIGQLLEAIDRAGIKENTTIIICGDHGFMDIHHVLYPNVWLSAAGLIRGKDWTAKFHSGRGSGFLRINPALSLTEQKNALEKTMSALNKLPDSTRRLFRIISKNELTAMGAYPDAAFAIVPVDGYAVGAAETGPETRKIFQKGTHGYLPDDPKMKTGFLVYGAGINQGKMVEEVRLVDIASLVSALLRLDFKSPDGRLPQGLLKQ